MSRLHSSLALASLLTVVVAGCSAEAGDRAPEVLGEDRANATSEVTGAGEPPCQVSAARACTLSTGGEGVQICSTNANGRAEWSPCELPGPTNDNTPLVLSFSSSGDVAFDTRADAKFDLSGIAASVPTHWPTAATPWLVRDRNGNGSIDDGAELFGSMTRLANGARATNGFEALRELDTDGDGSITPADDGWATLRVWRDANGDRISSPDELRPLDAYGVRGISLGFERRSVCDAVGNCGVERAAMRFERDGESILGSVVDVHLPSRVSSPPL